MPLILTVACSGGVTDTVRVASIELEPQDVVVSVGAVAPLTAVLEDASGNPVNTTVAWTSSDTSIARVSPFGVVTARKVGDATIAATVQGLSATASVSVSPKTVSSVRITPSAASVRVGGTTQLEAIALDAANEELPGRSMVWSSSNSAIASVDQTGLVTGRIPGAVTVTAVSEDRSASAAVTVTLLPVGSVSITPSQDTLRQGDVRQLSATMRDDNGLVIVGRTVSWSSGLSAVVSVTSGGLITAVSPGKAIISASSEGKTGTAEIVVLPRAVNTVTVSPSFSTVEVGATTSLATTLRDTEGSVLTGRAVSWSTLHSSIATVSTAGVVTAVSPGDATIVATSEGRTGSAVVRVIPVPVSSVTVSPPSATILTERTTTLSAIARSASGAVLTGRQVNWSSGAAGIATVSNAGVVTGVAAGTVLIFAEVDGVTGSSSITVQRPAVVSVTISPASPALTVNGAQQLSAIARDSEGNVLTGRNVSWSSNDETTVFVTSGGSIIGLKKGTATITATIEGVSGSTVVTVN